MPGATEADSSLVQFEIPTEKHSNKNGLRALVEREPRAGDETRENGASWKAKTDSTFISESELLHTDLPLLPSKPRYPLAFCPVKTHQLCIQVVQCSYRVLCPLGSKLELDRAAAGRPYIVNSPTLSVRPAIPLLRSTNMGVFTRELLDVADTLSRRAQAPQQVRLDVHTFRTVC